MLLTVISWLGQELFDLLAAESPASLGLEAQGQRVGMGAGVAAGQNLQLSAELGPVHWSAPAIGSRSKTACACSIDRQTAPTPPS